jgi:hypothetical protein
MSDSLARIIAIVRADFLVRFRRPSTLVVFLLLSALAYLWIPDPSTGRALLQIDGQRALLNSGALGMATASLGMIFVGLFGFYVISNSVRRDITTRCGFIIASTPMRTGEYLSGKFLGNVSFLAVFVSGFMLSSMVMLLVRAEARLEPLIFMQQYLLLTPPAIVFVSSVAVLFESVRFLSGKLGDVFYFFLWMAMIGLVVSQEATGSLNWGRYFDVTGFGFMIDQMQSTMNTDSVAIGSSTFDATKPPIVFNGLYLTEEWATPRIGSLLMPLSLLPLAALFFHRFDPVRIKAASDKGRRSWIGRAQVLLKPLSRGVVGIMMRPACGHSLGTAIWADAVLTLTLFPLALIAFAGCAIASIAAEQPATVQPVIFLALGIIVSDVVTRDRRAGTSASLYAAPRLRENLVSWKLGSTIALSLLFCAAPLLMTAPLGCFRFTTLLVGIIFVAGAATSLGVITGNAKAFLVAFLTFWYVVINERGASPRLDFAGFHGTATAQTPMIYAALTVVAVAVAQLAHRRRIANL